MIRVSDIVRQLLLEDGFVIEALQRGLLNTTAYAKEVHKIVERKTMKPVKIGTIVVALSRISQEITLKKAFSPKVTIENFTITSSLSEVTFERTTRTVEKLKTLNTATINGEFFTVTEGLHEVTIICSTHSVETILKHFRTITPKAVTNDLIAVSVRFSDKYLDVPNTIYSLVKALATRYINIMEIVSTYTELTFVVNKKDMDKTIQALNTYSEK